MLAREPDASGLTGTDKHHGFVLDGCQPLIFKCLEDASNHFPGTTDDPPDLLTSYLDLVAIRMGHGLGFVAWVEQRSGDAADHVQKG